MLRQSALIITLATPAVAGDFSLGWPVDCALGESCFIQQYVDHDPTDAATDFHCQSLSYDGHKGTDIALPSLAAMAGGVDVLAAAPGIVAGTRDSMADAYATQETRAALKGRECGNGLVIRHADGWETQYCHMKRGSLQVASGDRVAAGQPLGQIGLSGATQFPHLHLSVRQNGAVIDPFAPEAIVSDADSCGAQQGVTLWADPPAYEPGGLIALGFSDSVPGYAAVKAGTADKALAAESPALVLWAYAFGTRAGDQLALKITAPDGGLVFETVADLDKTQAQMFRAGGKRLRAPLLSGAYIGEAKLLREGQIIDQLRHRMEPQ